MNCKDYMAKMMTLTVSSVENESPIFARLLDLYYPCLEMHILGGEVFGESLYKLACASSDNSPPRYGPGNAQKLMVVHKANKSFNWEVRQ